MHVKTDKPPSSWMKRTNGNGQVHLPGPGHPAKSPDIRPLEQPQQQQPRRPSLQGPDIRPQPGNPAKSPDIRRHATEHPEVLPSSPDIRPPLSAHSKGRGPCTPSTP